MVTAKPLGQLKKSGVVASFVTLARHNSKSGGTQCPPIQYGREVPIPDSSLESTRSVPKREYVEVERVAVGPRKIHKKDWLRGKLCNARTTRFKVRWY